MKKFLLGSAALAALIAGPALAADLPVKAPAYVPPPVVYNWTGCYVGAHAGGGVMRPFYTDQNGAGALAGGQVGCNYQAGQFVFGIEGEGWWSGLKSTDNGSDVTGFAFHAEARNRYDFDVALRLGLAIDRVLIYGKAGVAWGNYDFAFDCNTCGGGAPGVTERASATLTGFLIGLGLEYGITPNWTAKFEYNYIGYTGQDVSFAATGNEVPFTRTQSDTKHIFKVGMNYKFGWQSAVVASY